jgi:ABC-2 type transport system permease protein
VKRPEINTTFVLALVKRDLWKYFTSPTGYVFITLFILLSTAAAFWQDRFFLDNLANLDQLNYMFPYLLLFFIPALTMSVWSEERKQGTDELLFTLPATSLEIVIGKYLATLGIYTASLVLSLSHVLVLSWLGSPDLGLMFSNYAGYWLLGGALIAVGMLASLLTANATIAFIVGAVFCAFFVLIDLMGSFGAGLGELVAPLGVYRHFDDFARGVMSFSGLLYFLSIAGLMIYVNVLLVEQRHWPREAEGRPMWLHHTMRTVGLVLAVIGLNVILGRAGIRVDATAEGLHSLSGETVSLISELSDERPVFIQAYVSPEVPEQLVQTRANLLGVLGEIESVGGARVQVLIEDTEPFTQEARDAREKFGITPRQVPHLGSARAGFTDVFLGVAFTCGAEEQVIPFLERGLPIEYEITRSVRVVARTERKKVGILGTEAKLFGGFDFSSMRSNPAWPVVEELRKQYDVVQVSAAAPIRQELDGLFAALPSSMPQEELDNLMEYIHQGNPTLLLVDPLPIFNIGLSPSERSGANTNPFQRQQGPPPKPKGDILGLLARIGVRWDKAGIVWDSYNPHPDLAHLPEEVVFVGQGNDNEKAFNREHPASVALQELVFLFPGHLKPEAGSDLEFQPLVRSGQASAVQNYSRMVQRNFFGVQLARGLPHRPDDREYTLAAHVRSGDPEAAPEESETQAEAPGEEPSEAAGESGGPNQEDDPQRINAIVVADLDFISQQFFSIRAQGPETLNFDNVTFFLNCMDVLVGDESFVALRNKRVRHRTLERVEEQTRSFVEQRVEDEEEAEGVADKALKQAQARLQEKVAEVQERRDLDAQAKQIMAQNLQEVENRRFEVLKANIEAEKESKINASKENMESQIRRIQGNIRTFAVLLPPVPVFVLGVLIFVRRQRREEEGARAARRLRS